MIPEDYAIVKDMVGPCGIKCGDCPMGNGTMRGTAIDLRKYLKTYDVPSWASALPGGVDIDFKRLEESLLWVERSMKCPGCINGGGSPECPIRICSKEKGHSSCSQCSDLKPCPKFDWLGDYGKALMKELAERPASNK
ncbi:MAG: DUF3795 domain-containing protein [Methanomassiliicoccales archaeon]|nr:DUF3795 domain-containing protein [Methanomassiliicoccales archaeon]